MNQAPSKYHRKSFVGIENKGADEFGNRYYWNSTHPELCPTQLINGTQRCAYCGGRSYPIQEKLEHYPPYQTGGYRTLGYTCICDGAEAEREYMDAYRSLEKKHALEREELRKSFSERLLIDPNIEIKLKIKELENEMKHSSSIVRFRDIEAHAMKNRQ